MRVLHWHDGELKPGCDCGEDQSRTDDTEFVCAACSAAIDPLSLLCRCNNR